MALQVSGPVSGEFFAGNDFSWTFTVTRDGAPVDITFMTPRFAMARKVGSPLVLTSQGATPNVTCSIISGPAGTYKAEVAAGDTVDLYDTYLYQTQVEDGSAQKSNVLHGYFTFKKNIVP